MLIIFDQAGGFFSGAGVGAFPFQAGVLPLMRGYLFFLVF